MLSSEHICRSDAPFANTTIRGRQVHKDSAQNNTDRMTGMYARARLARENTCTFCTAKD
jgi:hypothetical protein